MASPSLSQTSTTMPAEVLDFANKHGIAAYLDPVLEIARQLFPNVALSVLLQEDSEMPDLQHIVIEADVSGWDAGEMMTVWQQWSDRIFQECPATHVAYFLLRMV